MVRRDLSDSEFLEVYHYLLKFSENGKLKYGALVATAEKFSVSLSTIKRLWKKAQDTPEGEKVQTLIQKKYKGRPAIPVHAILDKIRGVPIRKRGTLRSTSKATGIALGTLFRALKAGKIIKYRSYVKPLLTPANKIARVQWCLNHIKDDISTRPFDTMHNIVHVDEKWFYLTKIKNTFYMVPEEELPQRKTKSKRFIPKVMFLAAVARPRYDYHHRKYFDGKIGIWAFTHQVQAIRKSKNRPAGAWVTEPLSVTKEVYHDAIINKVIPAIKEKWPGRKRNTIYIQQDNAKPHSGTSKKVIEAVGAKDGWYIKVTNQPVNSPDLNILDLGFFNAIQSLQNEKCAINIDELVSNVLECFNCSSSDILNNNFITLTSVMQKVLEHKGNNDFRIPHLGKAAKKRKGAEISRLFCDTKIYKEAKTFLGNQE